MKNSTVLVPFPFDDLSDTKVRPAVCLTNEIKPYDHLVLAFVTSRVLSEGATDLTIRDSSPDFPGTVFKVSSTIRLHRLVTVSRSIILRKLGELSLSHQRELAERLRHLFGI